MFGGQLYKNNARALLSRILSILNLDWLQHARSVRGVYEFFLLSCCFLVLSGLWFLSLARNVGHLVLFLLFLLVLGLLLPLFCLSFSFPTSGWFTLPLSFPSIWDPQNSKKKKKERKNKKKTLNFEKTRSLSTQFLQGILYWLQSWQK